MKIHALTTGSVRVKRSFLFPSRGPRRQLDLFLPGPGRTRCRFTAGRSSTTAVCCSMRRILRQPLPAGFAPRTFALDAGPFGAFQRSRALSDDGRIVAVGTPGHTPGHVSVICIDDSGRHTIYLPSHDPGSVGRLAGAITVG